MAAESLGDKTSATMATRQTARTCTQIHTTAFLGQVSDVQNDIYLLGAAKARYDLPSIDPE